MIVLVFGPLPATDQTAIEKKTLSKKHSAQLRLNHFDVWPGLFSCVYIYKYIYDWTMHVYACCQHLASFAVGLFLMPMPSAATLDLSRVRACGAASLPRSPRLTGGSMRGSRVNRSGRAFGSGRDLRSSAPLYSPLPTNSSLGQGFGGNRSQPLEVRTWAR